MYQVAIPCLVLAAATAAMAKDVWVSPGGSDTNAGTRQQPFASVARALESMRGAGPGTVWLAPGEYYLSEGLGLNEAHSGRAAASVELRAEVPHQARITGAREVTGFRPITPEEAKTLVSAEARAHVLVADLKAQCFPALAPLPDSYHTPGCEEVIFGDVPMQSARWPNEGFTAFTEVIDAGASDPVHWVTREVYRPGSFRFPTDRAKLWDFSRGVYLHGFWCYEWSDETLKVATYTAETGEARFAAKHAYGIGNPRQPKSPRNFYAIHVFEELDCPGEYYLDRPAGKLYFWPPSAIGATPVRLSLLRQPLFRANRATNLVVRDLVFENTCG